MPLLKRFAQGELQLNRIEAFSDGVFAIGVTLLVLELKAPILRDHASTNELGHQHCRSCAQVSELADQLHYCLQVLVESSPFAHLPASCHLRNGLAEFNLSHGASFHSLSNVVA